MDVVKLALNPIYNIHKIEIKKDEKTGLKKVLLTPTLGEKKVFIDYNLVEFYSYYPKIENNYFIGIVEKMDIDLVEGAVYYDEEIKFGRKTFKIYVAMYKP